MTGNNVMNVDVAIIGGGIGGLTTAVALNKAGIDAHVFEQAPAYGDVGGHLTTDDAAISVLARWGLDKPFRDLSCALVGGMSVRDLATGNVIMNMPIPDLANMGVADESRKGGRILYAFLRTDYLDLLVESMPAERIHTGHKVTSFKSEAESATASFENGVEVTAKIMLFADGVRSLARAQFDDSPAVRSPHTILRTLCPSDVLPAGDPNDRVKFWDGWEFGDKEKGIGALAMCVPVREGKFLSIDLQFFGGDLLEDCDPQDTPIERVMARYPAADSMDPLFSKMMAERIEPIGTYAIYDREVSRKWVDNRVALIGDAAHSMRPNLGQGASQSIHDAGELAKQFAEHGLTHEALVAYEAVRKPYTQSVVEASKNVVLDPEKWSTDS